MKQISLFIFNNMQIKPDIYCTGTHCTYTVTYGKYYAVLLQYGYISIVHHVFT